MGFSRAKIALCSAAALKIAARFKPDIILLDADLPSLGGASTVRQLLASRRHPKILCWSENPLQPQIRAVIGAGAGGFASKNISAGDLKQALKAVADGSKYFCDVVVSQLTKSQKNVLTSRHNEILQMIKQNLSTKEIALKLGRSINTIEAHRYEMMSRLGVHSKEELVKFAGRGSSRP